MQVILFDTETTGLKNPRLVQLAWKSENKDVNQMFFKPPVPIEFGAMAVHHITNEDVEKAPIFDDELRKFWQKKLKDVVAVAHNLPFDVGVMRNEGVIINGGICTLKVARFLFPNEEQHKMQYLRYSLKLKVDREAVAHDAKGDVMVLDALFNKLYVVIAERMSSPTFDDIIEEMIKITGQPSILNKISFGKHRGKTIKEIIATDSSYIDWLLKQPTLDNDLKYSINYHKKNA